VGVRVTILGNRHHWDASRRGLLSCLMVSRSLIEFQVRVHRTDADDTEAAQRPDLRTLRPLCGLGASAVKWRLQNYDSPKIVTRTPKVVCDRCSLEPFDSEKVYSQRVNRRVWLSESSDSPLFDESLGPLIKKVLCRDRFPARFTN
jgi:hypothetical protein